MKEINLGDLVKDKITGFTGIVTGINTYYASTRRIVVSSRDLENGKPIGEVPFDEVTLEILEEGFISFSKEIENKFHFLDEVKSKLCPTFKGKVVAMAFFITGCVKVAIQSPELKDGSPINWEWLSEEELELVTKREMSFNSPIKGGPMPTCTSSNIR